MIGCDILIAFLRDNVLSLLGEINVDQLTKFKLKETVGRSFSDIFIVISSSGIRFIDFDNLLQITSSLLCYKNCPNKLILIKSLFMPSKVDCKLVLM